jgi:hypothetical protein
MSLNCNLLCTSGAAYGISAQTGQYSDDDPRIGVFSKAAAFSSAPIPVSGANILNACLVGKTEIGIVVAFRGTVSSAWRDWLQDAMIEPVKRAGLPGRVHEGFADATLELLPQIVEAVNQLKPDASSKVYVTGHSKGGGMAPLAAYLLQAQGVPIAQTVTFAAPRSGDQDFKNGYETTFKNHVRYENYGDLVPLVPVGDEFGDIAPRLAMLPGIGQVLSEISARSKGWGYVPVGSEMYISKYQQIKPDENVRDQVGDFLGNLAAQLLHLQTPAEAIARLEKAIVDAHILACGHGYVSGTCPGLCG